MTMYRVGIGQDSHRFEPVGSTKPLKLGGVTVPGHQGLDGNSDADVVFHALTNAISGISGVNIIGSVSDELCLGRGITDSGVYLGKALDTLGEYRVSHVSLAIECKVPKLFPHVAGIKASIAEYLSLASSDIGITVTTGEGLTAFGRGIGIQVFAVVTARRVE